MQNRTGPLGILPVLAGIMLCVAGCANNGKWSVTEIGGKTSFGPEWRNFGNNTHDIRYTAIQGLDFKLANKWNLGVSYQRRDVDEGSGDNENLVLFEVGYPIWNAPKKAEKSAVELEIEGLERELRLLNTEVAVAVQETSGAAGSSLVEAGKVK